MPCPGAILRVHQAKPAIAQAVSFFYLLNVIQKYVIRFIADRMNAHLQSGRVSIEQIAETLPHAEIARLIDKQRSPAATTRWIV